jgi:hypothetical protein
MVVWLAALAAIAATSAATAAADPQRSMSDDGVDRSPLFGDVRDRLGCQLPGHTHYPFCNTSLPIALRAADLVRRVKNADKPALLTARAVKPLPELGVPSYYYGTNCLHTAITECVGGRCPTAFPAAPNWQSSFDVGTMEQMAAVVGKELRAAFNLNVRARPGRLSGLSFPERFPILKIHWV